MVQEVQLRITNSENLNNLLQAVSPVAFFFFELSASLTGSRPCQLSTLKTGKTVYKLSDAVCKYIIVESHNNAFFSKISANFQSNTIMNIADLFIINYSNNNLFQFRCQ